jgi:hypothetical protein
LVSLLLLLSLPLFTQTPTWVNGQAARALIGQNGFAIGALGVPNQSTLGAAGGVAFENGTLWVADATTMCGLNPNNGLPIPAGLNGQGGCYVQDNRVLGFPTSNIPSSTADLTSFSGFGYYCNLCGFPASIVLGQPNFTSFEPGTSQVASSSTGSMQVPTAVASDGTRLAVADTNNNRVLLWNSVPTSNNAAPDTVLGQTSFTGNYPNETAPSTAGTIATPTASSLSGPSGVWINPDGHVFVADSQNNRVLIWNSFPSSNNQPADLVLGQTNLGSGQSPCPARTANQTYTGTASVL